MGGWAVGRCFATLGRVYIAHVYTAHKSTVCRRVVVVVVVGGGVGVLTLTRIIKSVVAEQAPVTLELRNTPGKNTNRPKVVLAYITADAIHASTRNI